MKNVLFILDYYGENASANGICIEKLKDELLRRNTGVYILSYGSADEEEEDNIIKCAEYKNNHKKRLLNGIKYYAKWLMPSKDPVGTNKKNVNSLFSKAIEIISKNDIETVVCIHLPVDTLILGNLIKKKFPQIKVMAYMLDAFSGGILPRFLPKTYTKSKKLKWESSLLNCFDKVILMNSVRNHCEKLCKTQKWYEKAIYLDVPMIVPQIVNKERRGNKISFVGTMSDSVRTPYFFLNILQGIDFNLSLTFAGKNSCGDLNKYCDSEYVDLKDLGVISHCQAEEIIRNSDFLINFGNLNSNLVPSKIFEYMSMGKPIISTYISDNDSSLEYLKKYPNVLLLDEREKDYDKLRRKLKDFIINFQFQEINAKKLEELFYKNTPKAFVETLCL